MAGDRPEHDDRRLAGPSPSRQPFLRGVRGGVARQAIRLRSRTTSIPRSRMGDDELFRELLALEIELRREAGQDPTVEEYVDRFPARDAAVRAVFCESASTEASRAARPQDRRHRHHSPAARQPRRVRSLRPTRPIGDYELIEEIARGGMGVVYRARHKGLKRQVALKMILSGPMATSEERQRFLREAELAANLDHPNIVPIYEIDEHDDRPFFSMKLVEGGSLSKPGRPGSAAILAPPRGWSRSWPAPCTTPTDRGSCIAI